MSNLRYKKFLCIVPCDLDKLFYFLSCNCTSSFGYVKHSGFTDGDLVVGDYLELFVEFTLSRSLDSVMSHLEYCFGCFCQAVVCDG